MSSKIEVTFVSDLSTPVNKLFTVRHFRNYVKTDTGKTEASQYGGHTVLADLNGDLYVAKCNPVYDKFSRTSGLRVALKHFIERNYRGYKMIGIKSTGINKFVVHLDVDAHTNI